MLGNLQSWKQPGSPAGSAPHSLLESHCERSWRRSHSLRRKLGEQVSTNLSRRPLIPSVPHLPSSLQVQQRVSETFDGQRSQIHGSQGSCWYSHGAASCWLLSAAQLKPPDSSGRCGDPQKSMLNHVKGGERLVPVCLHLAMFHNG